MNLEIIIYIICLTGISAMLSIVVTTRARKRAYVEVANMMAAEQANDLDNINTDELSEPPYATIRSLQQQADACDKLFNMASSSHANLMVFSKLGLVPEDIISLRKSINRSILDLKHIEFKTPLK